VAASALNTWWFYKSTWWFINSLTFISDGMNVHQKKVLSTRIKNNNKTPTHKTARYYVTGHEIE